MSAPSPVYSLPQDHVTDALLQESFLFVADVLHNNALQRDAVFYRRGCGVKANFIISGKG